MTRHIIDKTRTVQGRRRTAMYLHMERQVGPHDASRTLQKRPKPAGSGRMREYLRIERGVRA